MSNQGYFFIEDLLGRSECVRMKEPGEIPVFWRDELWGGVELPSI